MTREEQITFEADKYTDTRNNYVEWGNGWEDFDDKEYVEKAFQAGAKWADKTIIEKACKWLEDWDRRTMFELSMIMGSNFIEDFRKAMED